MKIQFVGCRQFLSSLKSDYFSKLKERFRLFYSTFFYNEFNNSALLVDIALNPIICFVDNFARYFGIIFVILVWILISNMIFSFYIIICYQAFQNSLFSFLLNLVIGTWLSVNTVFHYYMGWRTSPGYAPTTKFDNVVSVCKKCLTGKPPRTHHCSVCNKCVLKMDHHCPWFNNCIGHFNHRYFYLFIIFMILDCAYLCTFGFNLYQKYVYPQFDITILDLFKHSLVVPSGEHMPGYSTYHRLTTIEFFVAFVAIFALIILAVTHFLFISKGLTNIELKNVKFTCCKPPLIDSVYDLGFKNNWKIFLGFEDSKSFALKVLLPSAHKPLGDGVYWTDYTRIKENMKQGEHIV